MFKKFTKYGVLVLLALSFVGCGSKKSNNSQPQNFNDFYVQRSDTFGDDFLRANPGARFRTGAGEYMTGEEIYYRMRLQARGRYGDTGYVPFDQIDPQFQTYSIYDPYYTRNWVPFGSFYNDHLVQDANRRYFGSGYNSGFMFQFNLNMNSTTNSNNGNTLSFR